MNLAKQSMLTAVVILALSALPARAVIIYQDDFSGDGSSSLNGAAPDVGLPGETWASGSHLKNNGVQDGAGRFTSLLPFTPEQGAGLYTLSADFTVTGTLTTSSNWLAVGFTEVLGTANGGLENRWLDGSTGNNSRPALWALARTMGTTATNNTLDSSFLGYAGGNHTFGGVNSTTSSATSLVITVDTTNPDWLVTWDFNGDGVDRTETVLAANLPDIAYVGFSSTDSAGTTQITNFVLDGPAPPSQWVVNGGGSFNTPSHWSANEVPTSSAVLGGFLTADNAPATVTIDEPSSLNKLTFSNSNSYILGGASALTLTGDATLDATQGTHFVDAKLSGSNGLTKSGAGTLVLTNGANNYTGNTTVSAGELVLTNLDAINQASGTTTLAAGATLNLTGDGLGNGTSGVLSEPLAGDGTLRLDAFDANNPQNGGLTTEVVTISSANASFNGQVSVGGGTLIVAHSGALGTADNEAATGTAVDGGDSDGRVHLSAVTVSNERLTLSGRQSATAAHLTNTGTSEWTGNVIGGGSGQNYNIESQSGTLTVSGNILLADSGERTLNLSGAGNGRIEGMIIDRSIALADGADNVNVNLRKTGTGTWTIATTPPPEISDPENNIFITARDGYHQGRTVIEQGTLAVQATGGTAGELFSQTIEVKQGATFDVSSFTNYSLQAIEDPDGTLSTGDETGQTLAGSGTVVTGAQLSAFDDSTIAPGDNVGTLTVNGNLSYSTFANTPAGSWDYQLGNTTGASDSDRLVVSGTATINAGAASNAININVTPVEGTLAAGSYTLVQAGSLAVSGAAGNGTYVERVRDFQGNDITAGLRQTVSAANTANSVVLNVTGTAANLAWNGPANGAWDVKTSNNWSGSGGPQFSHLDNVTFGAATNKTVIVSQNVAPGSVTFNGGAGSIYTLTGSGGMTGFGPVNVDSGTVQLQNSGNAYAGATTVASGATLEINTATTGGMVVNGTLSVGGDGVSTGGGTYTFFSDNFDGGDSDALHGTTPDTSFNGAQWVGAAPPFMANGDSVQLASPTGGSSGASATLAFEPLNGSTYVLETSLSNITGDTNWFGAGFANGQTQSTSIDSRFISGNVEGVAWMLYRGTANASNQNQVFLGTPNVGNGITSGANWLVDATTAGGDVALRVTLDTTGGPGNWTATWEADTGSGFQIIRNTETLLSEAITSVGVANAASHNITGTIESFTLTASEPVGSRLDGQTLTIDGDLMMGSTASLALDIALLGQDFVDVSGVATLDGTIEVTKLGNFIPSPGTEYIILSAAEGITDLGVDYILPAGFHASIVDATDLVLSVGLLGDFNGDQVVDLADYTVWRNYLGTADESVLMGNGDGLNGVDVGDYVLWKANFGNSYPTAGTVSSQVAVPEPTTWVMLLLSLAALWRLKPCPTKA